MEKHHLNIFSSIPILETERLVLRRLNVSDLDDVFKYAADPRVSEYLLWYPHQTKDFTRRYLKFVDKKYKKNEFYDWAVTVNGHVVGTCGFTSFDIENNCAEIGYVLRSDMWGQGLAAEAARAVITFGFEVLSLNRIEAKLISENASSARVLDKCGMTFEGVHRSSILSKGRYRDIAVYSITKDDYITLTSRNNG
ncbi:MAG: GNAT family N-acetyltransferase [Clostridia bacterium]|nr:GNAT family N-acetyltransferase [Clostridia bacterium]